MILWDLSRVNGDLTGENWDLSRVNGDLTGENWDLSRVNGDLTLRISWDITVMFGHVWVIC